MNANDKKLILKRGRAKPLWYGHPWVYAQAVARYEGDVTPGNVVHIHDERKAFVGRGVANPASSIAVRILTRNADEAIDGDFIRRRLRAAYALRKRLGLPNDETNCYRLVNAEGDGLSGIIVDVYDKAIAIQRTAAGFDDL
ncbi:MAG: rRNA large subunit methyltransferase I, partial [Deltaproteobacteria bacterium]|nr:rRNA large subunit methyltransferase I [Deltaproteobacteria bacterium]